MTTLKDQDKFSWDEIVAQAEVRAEEQDAPPAEHHQEGPRKGRAGRRKAAAEDTKAQEKAGGYQDAGLGTASPALPARVGGPFAN